MGLLDWFIGMMMTEVMVWYDGAVTLWSGDDGVVTVANIFK